MIQIDQTSLGCERLQGLKLYKRLFSLSNYMAAAIWHYLLYTTDFCKVLKQ